MKPVKELNLPCTFYVWLFVQKEEDSSEHIAYNYRFWFFVGFELDGYFVLLLFLDYLHSDTALDCRFFFIYSNHLENFHHLYIDDIAISKMPSS